VNELPRSERHRKKWVFALIVLASVLAFLSIFAIWAKRQLLESQTWADTSTKLLENQHIQTAVAGYAVDTLFTNVPVQQDIQAALPPRAAPAAGPIAGALRQLSYNVALRALQSPKVQQLWEQANKTAQQTLVDVVEKGGSENVKLDLGNIVNQLGEQVGVSNAASKLPAGAAQITILDNSDLVAAQKGLHLLHTLAWLLLAVALLLYALAIYLAEGWRRIAFRDIGWAFIIVGVASLVIRSLAGTALTNHLATTEAIKPAVSSTWTIGTSLLRDIGGATIFYGIVILIGSWLAAPAGLGRSARRELAPVLASRGTAYGALAVLLLLLFWWAPTPGFERLAPSILIIVLLIVGLEVLRREAIRDFPDETWDVGMERWRRRLSSIRPRRSGGATAEPTAPAPPRRPPG
jgi:hypothetical protein